MTDTLTSRPHLEGSDLFVDGRKFVVLGAETHNSSSSTPEAIRSSFARVREMGANTVLAAVAWDLFEPEEGHFDTTLIDAMLAACRREGLRLIPLWFGAWKNGQSTYAPAWVKTNIDRFPRAEITGEGPVEHLSPFGPETAAADAAAFRALMAHLREVAAEDTVVMVQVENEVGLLGDSRDRSSLADRAWAESVPAAALDAISTATHLPVHEEWVAAGARETGSWGEAFGDSPTAHEAFMAHAYAHHIEIVAAAGRAEFEIPLFVNAWLNNPPGVGFPAEPADAEEPVVTMAGGAQPGTYPSGGPLPRVAPIWTAAAPSLDFLAPDIYFGDPDTTFDEFRQVASRLFIPEMRRSTVGVGQMFLAIGEYGAIGASPFGVDSLVAGHPEEEALRDAYALLTHAAELSSEAGTRTRGFQLSDAEESVTFRLGDVTVTIDCRDPFGIFTPSLPVYGLLVLHEDLQLTAIGRGFRMTFEHADGRKVGILSADELARDDAGTTRVTRRWNGDETAGGSVRIPPLSNDSTVVSPIPVMTTSTGVVHVDLYTYQQH